jgi:hypothetical protein
MGPIAFSTAVVWSLETVIDTVPLEVPVLLGQNPKVNGVKT